MLRQAGLGGAGAGSAGRPVPITDFSDSIFYPTRFKCDGTKPWPLPSQLFSNGCGVSLIYGIPCVFANIQWPPATRLEFYTYVDLDHLRLV